ncbi:hypothetical protein [Dactylosporangium sp. CA-092794]|uniref:hypothetical protein n=1 Tax=Dactylosporangium sp. CA-092794 TaxID=3239929 RepID=UPI003D92561C
MGDTAGGGSVDRAALRGAFRRLGLDDELELWVAAEAEEGMPQLARYRFLSALWPKMIDTWRSDTDRNRIARSLLADGANREELIQFARSVAYDTVFSMLYYLEDDGRDDCADLPTWALVQTRAGEPPSGQVLGALFEDLLSLDPSGNEGADIVPLLPGPWMKQADRAPGDDPA